MHAYNATGTSAWQQTMRSHLHVEDADDDYDHSCVNPPDCTMCERVRWTEQQSEAVVLGVADADGDNTVDVCVRGPADATAVWLFCNGSGMLDSTGAPCPNFYTNSPWFPRPGTPSVRRKLVLGLLTCTTHTSASHRRPDCRRLCSVLRAPCPVPRAACSVLRFADGS